MTTGSCAVVLLALAATSAPSGGAIDANPRTIPMYRTYVADVVSTNATTTVLALAGGQQVSVSTEAYVNWKEVAGPVRTVGFDRKYGACGSAYIGLQDTGSLEYTMITGFDLTSPATSYSWEAYINGAGGTPYEYHYTAGGGLNGARSWQGRHVGDVPAGGLYAADVVPGGSTALLADGGVCAAVTGIMTEETIL